MPRCLYRRGGYTDRCYLAAGWGEPDRRYWIDADEVGRRLGLLSARYASVGIHDAGRRHDLDFDAELAGAVH